MYRVRTTAVLSIVLALLVGMTWGCGGVSQEALKCGSGEQHFTKGCGDGPSFAAGCYATCDTKNTCPQGSTCTKVSVIPGCASGAPGQPACDACGAGASICLPDKSGVGVPPPPEPGTCNNAKKHYEPGCGDGTKFQAGCYTDCTSDSNCDKGSSCKKVSVNPCPTSTDKGLACGACGRETMLCLPDPKPAACTDGKEYFEPGCGTGDLKPGCYATCGKGKSPCAANEECKEVSVHFECSSDEPNGLACTACGRGESLCMPKATTTTCAAGKEHHSPGCGEKPKFATGCYAPCSRSKTCGANEVCKTVDVIPTCAKKPGPGGAVCNACGAAMDLCFPNVAP